MHMYSPLSICIAAESVCERRVGVVSCPHCECSKVNISLPAPLHTWCHFERIFLCVDNYH